MISEMSSRLLAIYLNDHLAGATGGTQLAQRAEKSNRGTKLGDVLSRISTEIEEDRATLVRVMDALAIRRDPVKVAAAWGFEKAGRLKPNGQLRGYSPLSRLVELEGLLIGVTGKLEMWRTLAELGDSRLERFDLEGLIKRAESQRRSLVAQHKAAGVEAFAGETA